MNWAKPELLWDLRSADLNMAEFRKHLSHTAISTCLQLSNLIWTKTVPAMWGKAISIYKQKKKKVSKLSNYQSILPASILARTMDKMVNAWLNWYLEMENLSPAQTDFRRHCPTNQKITILSQGGRNWQKRNDDYSFCWFYECFSSAWGES